jgi:hypothetical protein
VNEEVIKKSFGIKIAASGTGQNDVYLKQGSNPDS